MKYKDAGVDVSRGYAAVDRIRDLVKSTFKEGVLSDIGGFGGMYAIDGESPDGNVLVAGTDGVGTKLKLAFEVNRHDTIGQDLVAMCVNDILCSGARPLFFLDYIATGKIIPARIEEIVSGIAEGCRQSGAALIGGETAEMPGFYGAEEYDLAGFSVGIVRRKDIIDGSEIEEGDVILGLASSGIHSNGYSLVRKIFKHKDYLTEIENQKLIDALLAPTRIYVKSVLSLLGSIRPKAMAHITGGGFVENIPRMMPEGFGAEIRMGTWERHPVFDEIMKRAGMEERDMMETFNCGVGFVLAVAAEDKEKAVRILSETEKVFEIGVIRKTDGEKIWFI